MLLQAVIMGVGGGQIPSVRFLPTGGAVLLLSAKWEASPKDACEGDMSSTLPK